MISDIVDRICDKILCVAKLDAKCQHLETSLRTEERESLAQYQRANEAESEIDRLQSELESLRDENVRLRDALREAER